MSASEKSKFEKFTEKFVMGVICVALLGFTVILLILLAKFALIVWES